MIKNKLPVSFGQIYQAAIKAGIAEQLEEELFGFAQLLKKNYEFKLFLEDARINPAYKKKQLGKIFPTGLSRYFKAIVLKAVDLGREDLLEEFSRDFTLRLSQGRGILFGEVFSAAVVPEDLKSRLNKTMSKIKNCPVTLRYSVKPELLGGVVVKFIAGEVWNISLGHKLNDIKAAIIK